MSTQSIPPSADPTSAAGLSPTNRPFVTNDDDGSKTQNADLPLWIFTVIALLGAALLSTYVGLLVYWRMRRRLIDYDRRMRHLSAAQREPEAAGVSANGDSGAAAVGSPSPRRPLTIAGSSSRSDSNSAGANGPSRRGWDVWSHAWAGRRPSEASRGNAEVMSASGESTHPTTVSFGSRFHVAQSPDVSVRLGTNSHRNNNANGRSLASSVNGHALYRGEMRDHAELRRYNSDGRAVDWSDGSGDQSNGNDEPATQPLSQWALTAAERSRHQLAVSYDHGRRTQQSHRVLARGQHATQVVMAEDRWIDEDLSYAVQRWQQEQPRASSLPYSWEMDEISQSVMERPVRRSADSAASHRFEVDVDDSFHHPGWSRHRVHGSSRPHWRASLTAHDGSERDTRRDSGATHLSAIISRRPSSRRSAASTRQSRLSSRPVSGDTSSSMVLGVLPPWEMEGSDTVLPAKRSRRTSHPAATLEWDFSLENRDRPAQRARAEVPPTGEEEEEPEPERKVCEEKPPESAKSDDEVESERPKGLTEAKLLSLAVRKALSPTEERPTSASSPQPAMLHL